MPSPPSITNLPTFMAFVERQEPNPDFPVPAAVVNEQRTVVTGWLYSGRRDSIELHHARLGLGYTTEERKLLQALRNVVSAGHRWVPADTQPAKPTATDTRTVVAADDGDRTSDPFMARIYKTRSQGTLYRSHLPVMAQLTARITTGKAREASDGESSPPSGT